MMKKWMTTLCLMMAAMLCLLLPAAAGAEPMVSVTVPDLVEEAELELNVDPQTLYEGYVFSTFYGTPVTNALVDRLDGMNLLMYQKVEPELKKVAAGTRTSTEFVFPIEDLGMKLRWTEDDLTAVYGGVPEGGWYSFDGPNGFWYNKDAIFKVMEICYGSYDARTIVRSLLRDHPYEFFWVASGSRYSYTQLARLGFTLGYDSDGFYVDFTGKTAGVSYHVDSVYAGNADFTTNPTTVGQANAARNNADSIVAGGAGMGDLERMTYYMLEIRKLSEYNHPAAADDYQGNASPWQMIYVFDGDPDTKIVCEGYAKAFKYLCDNTVFQDPKLEVLLVTGGMGNGVLGPHMWNMVITSAGNYVVDVTNCLPIESIENNLFFSVPTGLVDDGYFFDFGGGRVYYVYDDETLALFAPEDLAPSDKPYEFVPGMPEPDRVLEITLAVGDEFNVFSRAASPECAVSMIGYGLPLTCRYIYNAESDAWEELDAYAICCGGATEKPLEILLGTDFGTILLKVSIVDDMNCLILPAELETIEAEAFAGTNPDRVVLNEGLTSVASNAFAGSGVKQLMVPFYPGIDVVKCLPSQGVLWLTYDEDMVDWASQSGVDCLLLNRY